MIDGKWVISAVLWQNNFTFCCSITRCDQRFTFHSQILKKYWRKYKMSNGNDRPNVICFVMDQLRYDYLGCMGNSEVRTPNIDSLADEGVVFDRAYVSNPLCMPARSTLFTGMMPRGHGVRTNGIPLNREIPTMPEALREAGYRTHSVGKLHLNCFEIPKGVEFDELDPQDYPESITMWQKDMMSSLPKPYYGLQTTDFVGGHVDFIFGDYVNWLKNSYPHMYDCLSKKEERNAPQAFNWAIPEEYHYNRWISGKACEFLESTSDDPFFLWCSFPDPHHPYAAPEPWANMYNPDKISLNVRRREGELEDLPPFYKDAYENSKTILSGLHGRTKVSDDELREMIAITYGMVSFVDQEIGRVMDKLDDMGLRENTIVVFLADHGDMMGDHWMVRKGPFHFDGLLRMPFIWSWPGHFEEGTRTNGLCSQVDFASTILDLCDVSIPEGSVPKIRESNQEPPPWAGKSLKEQLLGNANNVNDYVIVENDEDYLGLRLRTFITDKYKLTIYPGKSYGELFDLEQDPNELYNLWDSPRYDSVKSDLFKEFLNAYILQDSALPRRLCHA